MLVLGSNDKDIEALSSLLTDEALSSLMQDRPSLLSYNKENSGLVFESEKEKKIQNDEEAQDYYNRLMKSVEYKFDDNAVRMELQNNRSVKELMTKARESKSEFTETINSLRKSLAKNLDISLENIEETIRKELKGYERTVEKTVADYHGDLSRILDVNGGTLTFQTRNEAESAFSEAIKVLDNKVANSKAKKTSYGYKDYKINIQMDNGFIGEMIFLDEDTMWAKDHLGHDIYDVGRKFEPYIEPKNRAKYEAIFGEELLVKIKRLDSALAEWSTKYYENSHDIKLGQYDNEGFRANLYAISSEITPLVRQLRENFSSSYSVGLSSYTLPSEVDLSMDISSLSSSLLNAVSQISKYLTAIVENASTTNITQNSAIDNEEKTNVNPNIYNKNINFIKRSEVSVLVPYTTEQMVGRIRVGKPTG